VGWAGDREGGGRGRRGGREGGREREIRMDALMDTHTHRHSHTLTHPTPAHAPHEDGRFYRCTARTGHTRQEMWAGRAGRGGSEGGRQACRQIKRGERGGTIDTDRQTGREERRQAESAGGEGRDEIWMVCLTDG